VRPTVRMGSIAIAGAALGLTAFAACSNGSGGGSGSGNAAVTACYSQCDAQSTATGCQPGGLTNAQCRSLCDYVVPGLSADCQTKAQASYSCGATAQWACAQGGQIPIEQGSACSAQDAAFAPCFSD
jgi:hypothetical protein